MKSRQGQVGIILLLITVVMLTVGISAVSRTTSDVNISNTNEIANQALDAAESGVEQALSQDLSRFSPPPAAGGSIAVNTQVASQRILQSYVEQGYTVGVDLTGLPNNTPVTVQWARETACASNASVVFTVFNDAGGATPAVRRFYYGPPASSGCSRQDNFTGAANATTPGYRWLATMNTITGDYLLRIRPLYNATDVRVPGTNLPIQSYTVRSTAQSTISSETKAVEVDRTLPIPPSVFDYVLFSATSITQ